MIEIDYHIRDEDNINRAISSKSKYDYYNSLFPEYGRRDKIFFSFLVEEAIKYQFKKAKFVKTHLLSPSPGEDFSSTIERIVYTIVTECLRNGTADIICSNDILPIFRLSKSFICKNDDDLEFSYENCDVEKQGNLGPIKLFSTRNNVIESAHFIFYSPLNDFFYKESIINNF